MSAANSSDTFVRKRGILFTGLLLFEVWLVVIEIQAVFLALVVKQPGATIATQVLMIGVHVMITIGLVYWRRWAAYAYLIYALIVGTVTIVTSSSVAESGLLSTLLALQLSFAVYILAGKSTSFN
jgi:hypothetical protein